MILPIAGSLAREFLRRLAQGHGVVHVTAAWGDYVTRSTCCEAVRLFSGIFGSHVTRQDQSEHVLAVVTRRAQGRAEKIFTVVRFRFGCEDVSPAGLPLHHASASG